MESSSLQELEQIPGVGKTIAQDMQNIGIHSIDALKGRQATRDTRYQIRVTNLIDGNCGVGQPLWTFLNRLSIIHVDWSYE